MFFAIIILIDALSSATNIESAARWMIILIVLVFDPLAVLLLIAANISLMQYQKRTNEDTEIKYPVQGPNISEIINETENNSHMEMSAPDSTIKRPITEEIVNDECQLPEDILDEGQEQKVKINDEIE